MTAVSRFKKFAGKHILIGDETLAYVPTDEQADGMFSEAAESVHPRAELEAGYEIVAVLGLFEEDGSLSKMTGFIAINESTDAAYKCDEGTIEAYDTLASKLDLELDDDGDA
jgi:hypothetical protein